MNGQTPPPSDPDYPEDCDVDFGEPLDVIELDDEILADDSKLEDALNALGTFEDMEQDEDVIEMATTVFKQHNGSVFCCKISPDGDMVATGGEDDMAYVWSITTGHNILTCTGHRDSVTCVSFSDDGAYLATSDMGGYIQVWKISTLQQVWDCEHTGDLNWLKWHPGTKALIAGSADGCLWKLLALHKEYVQTFGNTGVSTQCGNISQCGKHIAVGYENGSVRVFDIKSGQCVMCSSGMNSHNGAITSIVYHPTESAVILTSSMDGTARIFNYIKDKVVGVLDCKIRPNQTTENGDDEVNHSVEVISIQPSAPHFAVTATLAGVITIWDLSSQVARQHIAQGCGSSQVAWHPTKPEFYTAGLDGVIRSYDVRSGELCAKYTGHEQTILGIDVSKDGSHIVTCSDDGTARVFKS